MNNKIKKVHSLATNPSPARSYGGPATSGIEYDADLDSLVLAPESQESTFVNVPGYRRQYSPELVLSAQSQAGVGNGADATDDTLQSVTVPGYSLKVPGKGLDFQGFGTLASNAHSKTIKVWLGATTLVTSGAVTTSGGSWYVWGQVILTATGQQTAFAAVQIGLAVIAATESSPSLDMTANQVLKTTGASGSSAASDILGNALVANIYN